MTVLGKMEYLNVSRNRLGSLEGLQVRERGREGGATGEGGGERGATGYGGREEGLQVTEGGRENVLEFCHHLLVSPTVQHLASLEELYASGNSISNLRELFHIKPLSHLTVLDLSDNPIAQPAGGGGAGRSRGYRMFTLYHVSLVKALDGKPIVSLRGLLEY